MKLSLIEGLFSVNRLPPTEPIPSWAVCGSVFSISKTPDELSIVCEQSHVPAEIKSEKDWRILKVEGPLDFALTGILAAITNPLAKAKISIFAISTFDTDYILVRATQLNPAVECLKTAGFVLKYESDARAD